MSVDPSCYSVDAHSCVLLETGLFKGDAAITTIQPYAVPEVEPLSESQYINDEEGAVELNRKAGNEHNITVLGTV